MKMAVVDSEKSSRLKHVYEITSTVLSRRLLWGAGEQRGCMSPTSLGLLDNCFRWIWCGSGFKPDCRRDYQTLWVLRKALLQKECVLTLPSAPTWRGDKSGALSQNSIIKYCYVLLTHTRSKSSILSRGTPSQSCIIKSNMSLKNKISLFCRNQSEFLTLMVYFLGLAARVKSWTCSSASYLSFCVLPGWCVRQT